MDKVLNNEDLKVGDEVAIKFLDCIGWKSVISYRIGKIEKISPKRKSFVVNGENFSHISFFAVNSDVIATTKNVNMRKEINSLISRLDKGNVFDIENDKLAETLELLEKIYINLKLKNLS